MEYYNIQAVVFLKENRRTRVGVALELELHIPPQAAFATNVLQLLVNRS
ncbi:hypothetical protein [Beggiatoa alba]|nr:hypothetical protein [Beggiatoa alba]